MNKMDKNKGNRETRKNDFGFTLIEIMIAMFILGVGLIGALSFFNSSVISNSDAKTELIAAGLAQEGSELMRNLADYKKLSGNNWTQVVTALRACSNRIDYRSLAGTHPCPNGSNVNICFDGNHRYRQCDIGETGMGMTRILSYRCVDINGGTVACGSAKGLEITSAVSWNNRTTTAKDIIYENNY